MASCLGQLHWTAALCCYSAHSATATVPNSRSETFSFDPPCSHPHRGGHRLFIANRLSGLGFSYNLSAPLGTLVNFTEEAGEDGRGQQVPEDLHVGICSSPFFSGGLSDGPPLVWLLGIIVKGVR